MSSAFWIQPGEAFYFGPPSSLPAGDSHHGRSLFPPPPGAWQGLIRTRLLAAAGLNLRDNSRRGKQERADLVGAPDALPAGWHIEGPIPAEGTTSGLMGYFPTPQWVLRRTDDQDWTSPPQPVLALPLDRLGLPTLASDLEENGGASPREFPVPVGAPKVGRAQALGGWLNATDMLEVLKGGHPAPLDRATWAKRRPPHWDLPPCAHWESRPGVAIDGGTGSAKQGMLYKLQTVRMADGAGLWGQLHGTLPAPIPPDALHGGIVTAGRKARPVFFRASSPRHPDWETLCRGSYLPPQVQDGARFWLYLLSHTYLSMPAQPRMKASSSGQTTGVAIHVRAALLKKPLWLGGISLESHKVRANLPHVPAGSAWLIELRGGSAKDRGKALHDLHNTPQLFEKPERAAFGEGITLVGLLPQT